MDRLKDKVAIVTGGASGIGEAAVRLFSAEGARVALADVDDERAEAIVEDLGDAVLYVRADVSKAADVESLVRQTVDAFGKLDVMYNNAAITLDGYRVVEHSEEAFDRQIAINLKGPWLGMKYAIPEMIRNGRGSIINTGSVTGLLGYSGQTGYGASKGGVIQLTRHVAVEYADQNIRVNCVCPGGTLTPNVFNRRPGTPQEEVRAYFGTTNPMGRGVEPVDIAHAAMWLASDDAAMVNGVILPVDGGRFASAYRGPSPRITANKPAGAQ